MPDAIPHLWYADKAEEAAAFYVSLLPNSRIDSVTALPADSPSGPAGSVKVVEFTLRGRPFLAINAGPRSIQPRRRLRHHVRRPG